MASLRTQRMKGRWSPLYLHVSSDNLAPTNELSVTHLQNCSCPHNSGSSRLIVLICKKRNAFATGHIGVPLKY